MEARVRHWLTLAIGPNRRLPRFSRDEVARTQAARFASRKGWISPGAVRSEDEIRQDLDFWVVTSKGAAAAKADPNADARDATAAPAGFTHAARTAAAMEASET